MKSQKINKLGTILIVFVTMKFFSVYTFADVFIELPTLGGQSGVARSVNNDNVVTGDALTGVDPETVHSFIWRDRNGDGAADVNEMVDLGTLPGEVSFPFASWAERINDSGTVVGRGNYTDLHESWTHAYRWRDTNGNGRSDPCEMEDLGTLGGVVSTATAVNNHGVIAGASAVLTGNIHAFMYSDPCGMVDLGVLPGGDYSIAAAISNKGIIAGSADIELGQTDKIHACVWIDSNIVDLGTLGGIQSGAYGINDNGIVVGDSAMPGDQVYHAVVWNVETDEMTDLGAMDPNGSSFACDINKYGVIVGKVFRPSYNREHAAMYVADRWVDLHETYFPDYDSSYAAAINNNGWVVGIGVYASGVSRGWILKLEYKLKADLNKNGIVDFRDFAIMANEWLKTEPWYPGTP